MSKPAFTRAQRLMVVNALLGLVLITVILQLWLLTATMHAFLGGETAVVIPAALVSLGCFALNAVLLGSIYKMEQGGSV